MSWAGGMREVVRVNSGFGEGGDGRINDGCIQEIGEGEGVDSSGVELGLAALVLFCLPCFRTFTMFALLLFVFIPPRSLLLLLELGVLSLVLHCAELVSGFALRRALVDVLLPCKGGHTFNGSEVGKRRSWRSRGSGRGGGGGVLVCCNIDNMGDNVHVGGECGQDEQRLNLLGTLNLNSLRHWKCAVSFMKAGAGWLPSGMLVSMSALNSM